MRGLASKQRKFLYILSLRNRRCYVEDSHKRYTPWSVFQDGSINLICTTNGKFKLESSSHIQGFCKQSHTYLYKKLIQSEKHIKVILINLE